VAVKCEAVDHQGVAEKVEELAGVADAVGASEPESVFEVPVDRLGVVAAGIQPGEVRVRRWDRPDVLGAVELPGRIIGVGVESDADALILVTFRQDVVVVPAVRTVLVAVAMRTNAAEFSEGEVTGFGELPYPDGTIFRVERDGDGLAGNVWVPETRSGTR
jgi:hypothetical protein